MQDYKDYFPLLAFFGGSLAAYLLGLIVNYFRREKRWLGFAIDSRAIIESESSDLKVLYKNQPIKKLHSFTVHIENVGNRALSNLPVRLISSNTSKIADNEVTVPDGVTPITEKKSDFEILIKLDLLNPKESAEFGLTVIDSDGELKLICRVEGLTVIAIEDRFVPNEMMLDIIDNIPFFPLSNLVRIYTKHLREKSYRKRIQSKER